MFRRSVLAILCAGLVVGCASQRRSRFKEPVEVQVALADRHWEERSRLGLDRVDAALLQADQMRPGDREVLWRRARVAVARGLASADERESAAHFGQARELALQCLDRNGGFQQQRLRGDWAAGLDLLPNVFGPCAGWAAVAWTRWMLLVGPDAAAADRDAATAVAGWAREAPRSGGLGAWALGVLAALPPSGDEADLAKARSELREARREDVGLWAAADLLQLVARPSGDDELVASLEAEIRSAKNVPPEDVLVPGLVGPATPDPQ